MKSKTLFVLSLAACLAARAATYNIFPNADGSFDLASVEAWDGNFPYAECAVLNNADAVYGVSTNVTFQVIDFAGARMTIDLSATPERKVTVQTSDSAFYPYYNGASLTLKGGFYYFPSYGKFAACSTTLDTTTSTSITLSDGVVVTNAGTVWAKNATTWAGGPALVMKGGAKLYSRGLDSRYSGPVEYSYTGDPTETGVCIDISDGAQFITGVNRVSGNVLYTGGGVMLVRGEGTLFQNIGNGYTYVGYQNDNAVLHVTDGARFIATNEAVSICNHAARRNVRLYVDNGGSATAHVVYLGGLGKNKSGKDQHLIAGPGGTINVNFTSKSRLYVTGTNNYVVVSNGTLNLSGLTFGSATTDRGHEFKIYGPSATLGMSSISSLIAGGSGHRFVLDGGANISNDSFYFANGTSDESGTYTSNTVEIVNNSKLALSTDIYFRNYAASVVAANGNTLRIATGGELNCRKVFLWCEDNTIVISNGTLTAFSYEALTCGGTTTSSQSGITVGTSGARVILEGENPLLRGTNTSAKAIFNDGTKVIFRPSPNGFTTSAALMSFVTYATDGTASLAFEGLADVQKNLRRTAIYTLAEARGASGTVAFTDEQLAAATGLIDGCRLYKSDDGKRLLLRIRANRGTVFTVR